MANRIEETALFNNLSKWEINFIESVRLFLKNAQPGLFSFRYFDYYIGIKTKGDSGFPFLFKKPNNVLIFSRNDKNRRNVHEYEINESNDRNFSLVISTITGGQQNNVATAPIKSKATPSSNSKFFDSLSEEEADFIKRFAKTIRSKFPKTVRFRNKKSSIKVVTYKGSQDVFLFKKIDGVLSLQSKMDGIEASIAIQNLDKADFNNAINIATNLINGIRPAPSLKSNENDNNETPISFSKTLSNEEKAFVLSFIKIVKEYYQHSFDSSDGKTFISFKEKTIGRALFWFTRKYRQLCFEAHPKDSDVITLPIRSKNRPTLISSLEIVKRTCDSYGIASANGKVKQSVSEKPVAQKPIVQKPANEPTKVKLQNNQNTLKIYSFIRDEFRNRAYNALPSYRALCRSIKTYFLDVVNKDRKIKFTNATEACESALFFNHSLYWTDKAWPISASIVYSYFKANTLVEKIQYYEEIKQVKMCEDYDELLNYFYYCVSKDIQIDYSKAPSITKDFSLIPIESLEGILENFKSYEVE